MDSVRRTIVNTLAQHVKTIFNVVLSLYSTRLVLVALGSLDYGLFSLVGGVVLMLGFLTNAMAVATQRHMSFYQGRKNVSYVNKVFVNSLFLHISVGVALAMLLSLLAPFLFDGFLNIPPGRIEVGKIVYFVMLFNMLLSFVSTPFRAAFIARENMIYISIVDVVDGVLKLLSAILLMQITFDRLIAYSCFVTLISLFNLVAFAFYAIYRFGECALHHRLHFVRLSVICDICGFAGWTVYSTGCIIGRTQGIAILLNMFFGPLINTAYGITCQVMSSVLFVSQSVVNAMSPQVIRAEGESKREKMLTLAVFTSKYAYLLLSLVVIPMTYEIAPILTVWLGSVPDYTIEFCRLVLIASLFDQLTIGLGIANQAIGQIRNYSLVVNTIKVMTVPVAWLCLYLGMDATMAMWCYMIFELLCALVRLPFLHYTAGLCIMDYFRRVFARIFVPTLVICTVCWLASYISGELSRFLVTFVAAGVFGLQAIYVFALGQSEKDFLYVNIIHKLSLIKQSKRI